MGHQESPRSTGYSSLRPRTEGTYRSIDDSRCKFLFLTLLYLNNSIVSNLQLDQMNERLSRIETLLLNLMPNQSSTNQIVNDFIRPDVHEISQDIRNIHFEDIFYCGAGTYPRGSVAGTPGYMCYKQIK